MFQAKHLALYLAFILNVMCCFDDSLRYHCQTYS